MPPEADVLDTGGAGFIGSHVADGLIGRGHDVVVFDELSGGVEANVRERATFVRGTVAEPAAVDELPRPDCRRAPGRSAYSAW